MKIKGQRYSTNNLDNKADRSKINFLEHIFIVSFASALPIAQLILPDMPNMTCWSLLALTLIMILLLLHFPMGWLASHSESIFQRHHLLHLPSTLPSKCTAIDLLLERTKIGQPIWTLTSEATSYKGSKNISKCVKDLK